MLGSLNDYLNKSATRALLLQRLKQNLDGIPLLKNPTMVLIGNGIYW